MNEKSKGNVVDLWNRPTDEAPKEELSDEVKARLAAQEAAFKAKKEAATAARKRQNAELVQALGLRRKKK
jgi:hypothetical protein